MSNRVSDLGVIKSCLRQWFMNYVVSYIPCWTIRRTLLRLCGINRQRIADSYGMQIRRAKRDKNR